MLYQVQQFHDNEGVSSMRVMSVTQRCFFLQLQFAEDQKCFCLDFIFDKTKKRTVPESNDPIFPVRPWARPQPK